MNASQFTYGTQVATTCIPATRGYPGPPGEQGVNGDSHYNSKIISILLKLYSLENWST